MRTSFKTGILCFLWIAALLNGTGLNSVYHIYEWTRRITIVLFVLNLGHNMLGVI